jgi:hypothetical protein
VCACVMVAPRSVAQLSANTREDFDLKFKMLNDVLDIIDIEQRCAPAAAVAAAAVRWGGGRTLLYA